MRTVSYESILHGVAATAGIDPANILAHEKVLLAEYINTAVKLCWDYYPWQEFTITEERYYRDEWSSNNVYSQGDEVYYKDKYYKVWAGLAGNPTGAPDANPSTWYEIGDFSDDPEWSESGLYYKGAKVKYEGKTYLCIDIPDGTTASGVDPVNFEYDGIDPTNTIYFREIDDLFERYIGYEQTGKNVIGTVISVHKSDPRYSSSTPLNFREGREGVYIEGQGDVLNKVWLRYREEAPEFLPTATTDSRIPRFLVPAIKAFAYKSWLIGDGQHEKSVIQETMGYDLLVKELDRIDLQQERGQAYRISREPYRRINARQQHVTEQTKDQIAALKSAASVSAFKVLFNGIAKNAVVAGVAVASMSVSSESSGFNAVKTAGSWVQGQDPAVEGRYLIFPDGYERPDGTGKRFPANTFFQITAVNTNGSPPYDIEYKAIWEDASGNIQSQTQAIMDAQHGQRGSFWETYGRNDFSSTSRISATASGQDIVKEASVTCSILAFTGTPFRGIGIGFVGGEETTVHEVTVNPSVIDESTALSDNSIWNVLEVGDRVGWKALNTSGANLYVNGSQSPQAVGSAIVSNLLYPKNVGAVVNTYQGTGIVQVDFKYSGNTYGWRFTQAGYDNFYLVTADDTILLGCGATAEVDGEQKSTVNLSVGTYLYACKESSRSVGSMPVSITASANGKNAVQASTVMGSFAPYPIAVEQYPGSVYYPLWESKEDLVAWLGEHSYRHTGNMYGTELTDYLNYHGYRQFTLVSGVYHYSDYWKNELGRTEYWTSGGAVGTYTGTPPAPPAITVEVTASESNTYNATASSSFGLTTNATAAKGSTFSATVNMSCALTVTAQAQIAAIEATVDTVGIEITASVNPIEPLNVDFSDLTHATHGMLYTLQTPTSGTGAGDQFYSFRDHGKMMWLSEDLQPAGSYRFRIRAYGVTGSESGAGIYNIQPYNTAMTTHIQVGFARDDGARISGQLYTGAGVADGVNYRHASSLDGTATLTGSYAEIPSYTAAFNLSNTYLGVPINSAGTLPVRGYSNGQNGFSYNYSTGVAAMNTEINNGANSKEGHVFEMQFVTYEPLGVYLTIQNGSLVFRPEDISFEQIS